MQLRTKAVLTAALACAAACKFDASPLHVPDPGIAALAAGSTLSTQFASSATAAVSGAAGSAAIQTAAPSVPSDRADLGTGSAFEAHAMAPATPDTAAAPVVPEPAAAPATPPQPAIVPPAAFLPVAGDAPPPAAQPSAAPVAAAPMLPLGMPAPSHRYDFTGSGTEVRDSLGGAPGQLLGGATLDAAGGATLDGLDDYVELPPGLFETDGDQTLLGWVRWDGGGCWQRVFDLTQVTPFALGINPDRKGLFLTPANCNDSKLTCGMLGQFGDQYLIGADALRSGAEVMVGIVYRAADSQLQVVIDGVVVVQQPVDPRWEELQALPLWLGRSRFPQDPTFAGRWSELRIYPAALSPEQLKQAATLGPDVM